MTSHAIKLSNSDVNALTSGRKSSVLIQDSDFQTGETVYLRTQSDEAVYRGVRTITHMLKNVRGIEHGFVVLSFNDPEADYLRQRKTELFNETEQLRRSNASLRGQITKLRRRVGQIQ